MRLDEVFHIAARMLRQFGHDRHLLRGLEAEHPQVATRRPGDLTAVARGRAVAAELGLQQDHVLVALREAEGSRHATHAAADDGDAAGEITVQCGPHVVRRVDPAGEAGVLRAVGPHAVPISFQVGRPPHSVLSQS
nr:hypothetical protein [Streptomyces venezuelae]